MSSLYEDKIKNMGNAGRNGGEYYTPRPLIKTIVRVVNPEILVKAPWKKLSFNKLITKGYLYGRGMHFVLINHDFSIFFVLK
jgi:hypothetical protein